MTKTFSYIFLEPGYKVLVIHRRLFPEDKPRFFVGVVDAFNENSGLMKATGYSFYPKKGTQWTKKQERRTKILSLTSGTLIVYELPKEFDPESASIQNEKDGLVLVDSGTGSIDLSEPV